MDLSTMIVDMLRGDDFEKNFPESVRAPSKPAALESAVKGVQNTIGAPISGRAYQLYKQEALANGEPVMSPAEFNAAQGK